MPVLKKMVGDRAFLIDDAIGYGMQNEIDRGARDNIKIRQYNNWTEQGLDLARKQKAVVRSYNMGFGRAAWGLYQQRIDSTGCHQWADQWGDSRSPENESICTRIVDGKIVTSVSMERVREGCDDHAYFYTLAVLADRLKQKNMIPAAQAAKRCSPISWPTYH